MCTKGGRGNAKKQIAWGFAGLGTRPLYGQGVLQGEYPKKQIPKESPKEVTAYNQVFYPESGCLLRRYSRDKAPLGAF